MTTVVDLPFTYNATLVEKGCRKPSTFLFRGTVPVGLRDAGDAPVAARFHWEDSPPGSDVVYRVMDDALWIPCEPTFHGLYDSLSKRAETAIRSSPVYVGVKYPSDAFFLLDIHERLQGGTSGAGAEDSALREILQTCTNSLAKGRHHPTAITAVVPETREWISDDRDLRSASLVTAAHDNLAVIDGTLHCRTMGPAFEVVILDGVARIRHRICVEEVMGSRRASLFNADDKEAAMEYADRAGIRFNRAMSDTIVLSEQADWHAFRFDEQREGVRGAYLSLLSRLHGRALMDLPLDALHAWADLKDVGFSLPGGWTDTYTNTMVAGAIATIHSAAQALWTDTWSRDAFIALSHRMRFDPSWGESGPGAARGMRP